jgi:hypothetical protein
MALQGEVPALKPPFPFFFYRKVLVPHTEAVRHIIAAGESEGGGAQQ